MSTPVCMPAAVLETKKKRLRGGEEKGEGRGGRSDGQLPTPAISTRPRLGHFPTWPRPLVLVWQQ